MLVQFGVDGLPVEFAAGPSKRPSSDTDIMKTIFRITVPFPAAL